MNNILSLTALMLLFGFACKPSQTIQSSEHLIQSIRFGSGGGFTGEYEEYELHLHDGIMKKSDQYLKTISQSQIKDLINSKEADILLNTHFDEPFNMTYFITLTTENVTNTLRWGDPELVPPAIATQLYDKLFELTK